MNPILIVDDEAAIAMLVRRILTGRVTAARP